MIVAAGPIANFVLAVAVLWLMFGIGVPTVKPIIGEVAADSIASRANLQRGDEIVQVGNIEAYDWQQVQLGLMSAIGNEDVTLVLRSRNGNERMQTLDLSDWQFDPETESTFGSLGIDVYQPHVYTELAELMDGSPAAEAGLQQGDVIETVNGEAVTNWQQLTEVIRQSPGQMLALGISRNGNRQQISALVGEQEGASGVIGYLGIMPKTEALPEGYVFNHQYGIVGGLVKGAQQTWDLMVISVQMIGKLLTGDVSVKNLAGPKYC